MASDSAPTVGSLGFAQTALWRAYQDFLMPNRLSEYRTVLELARDRGYQMVSVEQWAQMVRAGKINRKLIILRHDVDTDPTQTLLSAEIEKAVGRRLPRVTLPDFDYSAKTAQVFEVPIAERIKEIRARKAADRQRAAEKAARKAGQPAPGARGGTSSSGQSRRPAAPARPAGEGSAQRPSADGAAPQRRRRRGGSGGTGGSGGSPRGGGSPYRE